MNGIDNYLNEEEFMTLTMWNFFDSTEYNINNAFVTLLKNPIKILSNDIFSEDLKMFINNNITNRIKKTDIVVKCYITAVVTSEEGINGLKNVLDITNYQQEHKIIVNMETPPKYSIQIDGEPLEIATKTINDVVKHMKHLMEKYTGYVDIMEEPVIIKEEELELRFISENILKELLNPKK